MGRTPLLGFVRAVMFPPKKTGRVDDGTCPETTRLMKSVMFHRRAVPAASLIGVVRSATI